MPNSAMFPFDDSTLRSLVLRDYESLTRGVEDAAKMNQVFDAIFGTASATVLELLNNFNKQKVIASLPAETLSACFSHLPFLSRISASHVCRTWRAAALADPGLWSTIPVYFEGRDQIKFVVMALARAADHPLDLEVYSIHPTPIEALSSVLEPHSHHLRYVGWFGGEKTTLWRFPAPRLQYLRCKSTLVIGSDFLGGSPGSLRHLHFYAGSFPAICPALATVVTLRIDDCKYRKNAFSYGRLFELFPVLESLSLSRLKCRFSSRLPTGPAPASLRQLTLHTTDHEYDLAAHYAVWETGKILRVSLTMTAVCPITLGSLLRDATALDISYSVRQKQASLVSSHPNSVSRSVTLITPASIEALPDALLAARAGLSRVTSIRLSHCFLARFLPVLGHLPELSHVVVHVGPESWTYAWQTRSPSSSRHTFDWVPLTHLPRLRRVVPGLDSLAIQVVCTLCHSKCLPDGDDARGLLEAVSTYDDLPEVVIRGFPDAALQGIDERHGIRFGTAEGLGPLVSHKMESEAFWPQAFERERNWEDRLEDKLLRSVMGPYRY